MPPHKDKMEEIDEEIRQLDESDLKTNLIEKGCQIAIVLGVLGVGLLPTIELKAASGLVAAGGAGVLTAPAGNEAFYDFFTKIFPPKEHKF